MMAEKVFGTMQDYMISLVGAEAGSRAQRVASQKRPSKGGGLIAASAGASAARKAFGKKPKGKKK
tara:strand:- start:252 stop:446 length:195 start_codon:yes stop_codon:yes gene_type:complete